MRGKEEAHDYRYFPDPDLVPLTLAAADVDRWRSELPELPAARRARFVTDFGLSDYDADVLTAERDLADYFEQTVAAGADPKKAANWMQSELLRECNLSGQSPLACLLPPSGLAGLIDLIDKGVISGKIAKQIFPDLYANGADPAEYVRQKGLAQISDTTALEESVDAVLAANPAEVEAYRGGKTKLMISGRRAKFYYLTQAAEAPPTFVFFVSDVDRVRDSYARYLENGLRKLFGIKMAPVKVVFRASHTPKDERNA